jgi:hypothetical protein
MVIITRRLLSGVVREVKSVARISEGKKAFGKPKSKWKYNVKINLQEILLEDMNWGSCKEICKQVCVVTFNKPSGFM